LAGVVLLSAISAVCAQTQQPPPAPVPATAPSEGPPPRPAFAPSDSNTPLVPPPTAQVGVRPLFATFDRNRDGSISRAEAAASRDLERDFDRYDVNRDGMLDRIEFDTFAR